MITGVNLYAEYESIASTDERESYFKPVRYWTGLICINANWSLWTGLLRYGYKDIAERIRQGGIKLVKNKGLGIL